MNKLNAGDIVRLRYPTNETLYGYVVRFVETSNTRDIYLVATDEYPMGKYYKECFLVKDDSNEAYDYVRRNIIPYHENGTWNGYIPESVEPLAFFTEMSEINPKYYQKQTKKEAKFHVCIFEGNEGPVPHIHVYYGSKTQKQDEHGNPLVAYVCLHKSEYAPQHASSTKVLNSEERKCLQKFFETELDTYRKDKEGNLYRETAWSSAVETWISFNPDSEKLFAKDDKGRYVMPNYKTIAMPDKKQINKFKDQTFRI